MNRGKRILFGLISLGISGLLCVVLLEWALRILVPAQEVPRWLVPSEEYGHVQKPDFRQVYSYRGTNVTWLARINNEGMRGPDVDLSRTDDRRILFVGDSFTFGYGLDEEFTFPFLVGRRLNEAFPSPPWTVLNTGVGGWGTEQQLKLAEARLAEFRPDIVVLTFCDNDLQDDVLFLKGKATGLLPAFPGKQWLRDNSRLYRILYAQLSSLLFSRAISDEDQKKAVEPSAASTNIVDQSNPGGPDLIVAWAEHWPRTLDRIRAFHARLLEQNPAALMIIQQAQPLRADIFAKLSTLDNGNNLRYIHLGLDVEQWEDRNVLLPYDPHWRKDVHELSASRIMEVIREAGKGKKGD